MAAAVIDAHAGTPASARVRRVLILLGLTSRVAYCCYATATVTFNGSGYRTPALAMAVLVTVVVVSTALGRRVWSRQVMSMWISAADIAVGVFALVALAAAIPPPARSGSENWALAYAVGCVAWLALGHGWYRLWLAAVLGTVAGASVLIGAPADPARIATVVVNATSLPLYFAVFTCIAMVIRRTAAEVDAVSRCEQIRSRELAALTEREHLFRALHTSVADALDHIASGDLAEPGLRALAARQAGKLRRAFASSADSHRLADRLAELIEARPGWHIEAVDEEMDGEPPGHLAERLCAALAELISDTPPDADAHLRLRLEGDRAGAQIIVRAPGPEADWVAGVARAGAGLAGVGSVQFLSGLPRETRLRLRVPE